MFRSIAFTKVFAVIVLIFANSGGGLSQTGSIYLIPAGKQIRVKMDTEINSKISSVNDTFTVHTAEPVSNDGVVVIPAGLQIDGIVTSVTPADLGDKDGLLEVSFSQLRLERNRAVVFNAGLAHPIRTCDRGFLSFLAVAGATAAGAIFGAAIDAKRGAAIGAAVGAGSGTGYLLLKRGRDVRIRTDEVFEIVLKKDVVLPAVRVY